MSFVYSKENLGKKERRRQRFFELVPGTLSWVILAGMVALSFYRPVIASLIAIAFIFYWFLRLLYMTLFLLVSFIKLNAAARTEWLEKIKHLKKNKGMPEPEALYHVVLLPVAKEPGEVLKPAVEALAAQSFPLERVLVVLGVEESAPEETKDAATKLQQAFKNRFFDFLVVLHPQGLPGEARVKGANASFAAKEAAALLKAKNIPFKNVLISCLDADTVLDRQYLACLTYYFLKNPKPLRTSYQPVPVYNNNIWNVPAFSRVMEIGSSFFQLIEASNPGKLVTFSSHSMSFQSLMEMDYWPRDMISDDSAIFWKAYLHYKGDYRAVPMNITVSMDATSAATRWQTFKNVYKQRRRWAYGVENFPILMRGFLKTPEISFYNKLRHGFKMLEGHVSWATWGFLLTTLGWLPALLSGREFQSSVVYYNEPHITGTIFRLSTFSLIISIILSMALLPRLRTRWGWLKEIRHTLEWFLMPFVIVFLTALPALDAQTRLLFGRHMEFWVTDKSRKIK